MRNRMREEKVLAATKEHLLECAMLGNNVTAVTCTTKLFKVNGSLLRVVPSGTRKLYSYLPQLILPFNLGVLHLL